MPGVAWFLGPGSGDVTEPGEHGRLLVVVRLDRKAMGGKQIRSTHGGNLLAVAIQVVEHVVAIAAIPQVGHLHVEIRGRASDR